MTGLINKNDYIVDGKSISRYIILEKIERPMTAKIKTNLVTIPKRDGYFFRNSSKEGKEIILSIRAITKDRNQLREIYDTINPLIFKTTVMRLELRDNPGRYEEVILNSGIDIENLLSTGFAQVKYINLSGVSYNKEITNSLSNFGNTKTPFKIRGTYKGQGNITITNPKTLDRIIIDAQGISNGANIEIDTELEKVMMNNKSYMKGLFIESDFWWLEPGENSIIVDGLNSIKYEHRARWI